MHQPEPNQAPDKDEEAIERRFAELMHRFWQRTDRPKPNEQGDDE